MSLEGIAIVLSLVALTVTVIGFSASLYFYHKGTELQTSVNNAVNSLDAKIQVIVDALLKNYDLMLHGLIRAREVTDELAQIAKEPEGSPDKEARFEDAEQQLRELHAEVTSSAATFASSFTPERVATFLEAIRNTKGGKFPLD